MTQIGDNKQELGDFFKGFILTYFLHFRLNEK